MFHHPERRLFIHTARGVPQGSSLGPTLWNLVFDGLLTTPLLRGFSLSAYADDLNIVVSANSRRSLESTGDSVLATLRAWTSSKSLTISTEKTKVLLMFATANLERPPLFHLAGRVIQSVHHLKILGCVVDSHLTWVNHALHLRNSVEHLAARSLAVARTYWGTSACTLKIWYKCVVERLLVYAGPCGVPHCIRTRLVSWRLLSGHS